MSRNSHYEKGFTIYNLIFAKLRISFFIYNLITSAFIIVPIVAFCFKYSNYPILSVCLYACFGCFTLNMSGIRQSLSCGICIISLLISDLFKSKFLKFLPALLIIPASLIHTSAIFFVFVYLLSFVRIRKRKTLFFFLDCSLGLHIINTICCFLWILPLYGSIFFVFFRSSVRHNYIQWNNIVIHRLPDCSCRV